MVDLKLPMVHIKRNWLQHKGRFVKQVEMVFNRWMEGQSLSCGARRQGVVPVVGFMVRQTCLSTSGVGVRPLLNSPIILVVQCLVCLWKWRGQLDLELNKWLRMH